MLASFSWPATAREQARSYSRPNNQLYLHALAEGKRAAFNLARLYLKQKCAADEPPSAVLRFPLRSEVFRNSADSDKG